MKGNHYVKSVRIWSFSIPYSVRMRENADQKFLNTDTSQLLSEPSCNAAASMIQCIKVVF